MTDSEVHLNIVEVRKPEIDATLVGEGIAQQLERRVAFRRAMKRAVSVCHPHGRARHPHQLRRPARRRGNLRAWSGTAEAACRCIRSAPTSTTARRFGRTAYGIIGVKVWIFKGEIMATIPWRRSTGRLRHRKGGTLYGSPRGPPGAGLNTD